MPSSASPRLFLFPKPDGDCASVSIAMWLEVWVSIEVCGSHRSDVIYMVLEGAGFAKEGGSGYGEAEVLAIRFDSK